MDDGDDIYMRSWTGTIIGPHNVSISSVYTISFWCGKIKFELASFVWCIMYSFLNASIWHEENGWNSCTTHIIKKLDLTSLYALYLICMLIISSWPIWGDYFLENPLFLSQNLFLWPSYLYIVISIANVLNQTVFNYQSRSCWVVILKAQVIYMLDVYLDELLPYFLGCWF